MIQIEDQRGVRYITLDRPEKRNALTMQMCKDIVAAVKSAHDVGCILISANGPVFCAGMDLHESAPVEEQARAHEELFTLGAQCLKPIVVSVNGPAIAGGLGLAAQGHIIVASPSATFCLSEIKIGFWPFIVYRAIEAAVGKRRALALSLTGEPFTAEEALTWGLVHSMDADATHIAHEIARSNPLAVSLGLRYVREAEGKSFAEAGQLAATLRAQLIAGAKASFQKKKHVDPD